MGMGAVLNQTFRLLSHDRLHRAVEIWEERYPGVDIILIEPELDDELMFGTSILDYRQRLQIAKHGFESVTLKLARDYDRYKAIAERHGIDISARRVRHVLDQVEREREKLSAWRRVLEQTTAALLRNAPAGPSRRVAGARRRLELGCAALTQIRTRLCTLTLRPSSRSASRADLVPVAGAQEARQTLAKRLGVIVTRALGTDPEGQPVTDVARCAATRATKSLPACRSARRRASRAGA